MKHFHISRVLEVQHRAKMQLAGGNMGVKHAIKSQFFKHKPEVDHIIGQHGRIYRGIFDHGHRFCITRDVGEQSQPGFPKGPHFIYVIAVNHRKMISVTFLTHIGFKC